MVRPTRLALMLLAAALAAGCASSSAPSGSPSTGASGSPPALAPSASPPPAPSPSGSPPPALAPSGSTPSSGVTYRSDEKLQKVWVADGFDFTGFNALYITEPAAAVPKLNPDGAANLEWARGVLRDELVQALRAKNAFATVAINEGDIPAGSRVLQLDSTVVEYEKGGGGARFFAGLYGAGQPVITVRGRMKDGDRLLFAFETRRSGVGGKSRWLGGYMSDKDVQTNDIRDLATAVADFVARQGKSR